MADKVQAKPKSKKKADISKPKPRTAKKPKKTVVAKNKTSEMVNVVVDEPAEEVVTAVQPDLRISTMPKKMKKVSSRPLYKIYAILSMLILFATTTFWSILSAKIQLSNSDQLVYEYLFHSVNTLHNASLPAQHSFLIKWPIFYLVNLLGDTKNSFIAITTLTVLLTVGCLIYFIHRIERRPLIFGTICLALASVLLLVPTLPYPGGLLPVNMAMINTRNLEYVFYFGSIALLVSSLRLKSIRFWVATASLTLLVASDKLFLTLAIGSAIIALVCYAYLQYWQLVNLSVKWLASGVVAAVGSVALLLAVRATGISFLNQGGIGPYGLVGSIHSLLEGSVYTILGLLTNFGANPATSATTLRSIPHYLSTGLVSVGGYAYLVNMVLLLVGIYFTFRVFISARQLKVTAINHKPTNISNAQQISIILIWSTIVACGVYVVSNHDYVVDSRYLTIALFAVFISAATYTRAKQWQSKKVFVVGCLIILGIASGSVYAVHQYNGDRMALQDINNRDHTIAQIMKNSKGAVLVGDYWRVMPAKLDSGGSLNVVPLSGCTTISTDLNTKSWEPNLHNHSFVYLLSLDKSLTNFPSCNLNQVVATYGKPNSSTIVSGSLAHPNEVLLFYDQGISAKKSSDSSASATTILPIGVDEVTGTSCDTPTIMNIVAHQDDDLLFMNPDTINSIKAGDCVRTVYVTAGNNGNGEYYWLQREEGSEAAYSYMTGASKAWVQSVVKVANNEYVMIASPKSDSKVSLVFMYLPDGDLMGEGFKSSNYESLAKLQNGNITTINTVDGQSHYTKQQLTDTLSSLMHLYHPTEVRTQSTYTGAGSIFHDHADHNAVGYFTTQAYKQYITQQYADIASIPIEYYLGYTGRQFPANVSGPDLQEKSAVFLTYAKFDGGVCHTVTECENTPTYGNYLQRQYQYDY